MSDLYGGKISTVIVKDLSRLGRNHILTGKVIEIDLPQLGVDFISVSEGLDSRKPGGQDKIVGLIHNTVNDIISAQTSQKVRDVNAAKVARGERLNPSNPPYGFTYDKEKKN